MADSRVLGGAAVSRTIRAAEDNISVKRASDPRSSEWDLKYACGEMLRRSRAFSKWASAANRLGPAAAGSTVDSANKARLKTLSSFEAAAVATSGSSHAS